jgi:hypothetical protein
MESGRHRYPPGIATDMGHASTESGRQLKRPYVGGFRSPFVQCADSALTIAIQIRTRDPPNRTGSIRPRADSKQATEIPNAAKPNDAWWRWLGSWKVQYPSTGKRSRPEQVATKHPARTYSSLLISGLSYRTAFIGPARHVRFGSRAWDAYLSRSSRPTSGIKCRTIKAFTKPEPRLNNRKS